MKKAVVYFLTAVLVTGASLPSTVAYAETVSDSEAVTDKAEAVSEETPDRGENGRLRGSRYLNGIHGAKDT